MKLFMIRHGQSAGNQGGVYAGQTDIPMTEIGRAQAASLRPILEKFSFDKVYTSDLQRAIETQKIALPNAVSTPTPLLREMDEGSIVGLPFDGAFLGDEKKYQRIRDYSIYNGENYEMVAERLQKFLNAVLEEKHETVAVFTHCGLISCMLRLVIDAWPEFDTMPADNCSINVFEHDGNRWILRAWNYGAEL